MVGDGEEILPVQVGPALIQDVEVLLQTDEGAVFHLPAAKHLGRGPRDAE